MYFHYTLKIHSIVYDFHTTSLQIHYRIDKYTADILLSFVIYFCAASESHSILSCSNGSAFKICSIMYFDLKKEDELMQIRGKLREDKIKLWLEPYYIQTKGSVQEEIKVVGKKY